MNCVRGSQGSSHDTEIRGVCYYSEMWVQVRYIKNSHITLWTRRMWNRQLLDRNHRGYKLKFKQAESKVSKLTMAGGKFFVSIRYCQRQSRFLVRWQKTWCHRNSIVVLGFMVPKMWRIIKNWVPLGICERI